MTVTDEDIKVVTETTEPGDHDKFSHYVKKDELTAAMIEGTPCIALCGKLWIPTRDGLKFPICPLCKHLFETTKFADD